MMVIGFLQENHLRLKLITESTIFHIKSFSTFTK